ncbi:hypothetical protein F53441_7446 [Fusarium austroafricanum]|uniref:Uncharacterized protein n=1 Tax=Fusarium austroafricanum TaxID=2364996 RepID=A0A8H4KDI8_9HYPO|nr:hypothetical protein F53441_7446 [Fusarium austroafricanum]
MAGKNSIEKHDKPLWRPLAHKLSTLILRRRPSKVKVKAKVDGRKSVADFRPLEVQVDREEGLHVPNNWLVKPAPANIDKPLPPSPSPVDASPIEDKPKEVNEPEPETETEPEPKKRPESPQYGHVVIHQDTDKEQSRLSALTALTANRNSTVPSILDRGRPVEARHLVRQPAKHLKSHRKSLPLEFELLSQMSNQDQTSDATTGPETKPDATASLSLNDTLDAASKRHSMLDMSQMTMPTRTATIRVVPAESTVKTSHPLRQNPSTLRKEISPDSPMKPKPTPAPTSAPSEPIPIPKLKSKPAGALSDRLAWIKKLEDKDNRPKDLPAMAKRTGSVSDKLAMFEKKNLSAASPARLHVPSRTNSSTYSAYSSVTSRDSIFSDGLSAPSPRTSVDTARTSSVMSYYDDSFREKLESLVGQEPKESEVENSEE